MTKYTSIPIQELYKVTSLITFENCPPPAPNNDFTDYRRIWIFKINNKIVLEFHYDENSHKKMVDKLNQTKFEIIGEIELHWNKHLNDWYINIEHL